MSRALRTQYGLKYDPSSPEIPHEAIVPTPWMAHFARRVLHLAELGGFALLHGGPGTGKSTTMRFLARKFEDLNDVEVGVLTHANSGVGDFYRELGELFGVALSPHNRWQGFRELRERWRQHIKTTFFRPILLVDEAQLMQTSVLSELRLLTSSDLDSRSVLTVVLGGNATLLERFRSAELQPLESRIRVRWQTGQAGREELRAFLDRALDDAGNPGLVTDGLAETLVERSGGNYRALKNILGDLLEFGLEQKAKCLDEKLFLQAFGSLPASTAPDSGEAKRPRSRGRRRR